MRCLEEGLPRFDMRSPALRAKQQRTHLRAEPAPLASTGPTAAPARSARAVRSEVEALLPELAILAQVAAESGVSVTDLCGRSGTKPVVAARRVACKRVAAALPGFTLEDMAGLFGREPVTIRRILSDWKWKRV